MKNILDTFEYTIYILNIKSIINMTAHYLSISTYNGLLSSRQFTLLALAYITSRLRSFIDADVDMEVKALRANRDLRASREGHGFEGAAQLTSRHLEVVSFERRCH